MIEPRDLIRILEEIPETRLRILELCHKVLKEDGTVDPQKVAFYSKELEEATEEAEQYSKETKEAARCLRELARSWH
jgi:hypothetical protein